MSSNYDVRSPLVASVGLPSIAAMLNPKSRGTIQTQRTPLKKVMRPSRAPEFSLASDTILKSLGLAKAEDPAITIEELFDLAGQDHPKKDTVTPPAVRFQFGSPTAKSKFATSIVGYDDVFSPIRPSWSRQSSLDSQDSEDFAQSLFVITRPQPARTLSWSSDETDDSEDGGLMFDSVADDQYELEQDLSDGELCTSDCTCHLHDYYDYDADVDNTMEEGDFQDVDTRDDIDDLYDSYLSPLDCPFGVAFQDSLGNGYMASIQPRGQAIDASSIVNQEAARVFVKVLRAGESSSREAAAQRRMYTKPSHLVQHSATEGPDAMPWVSKLEAFVSSNETEDLFFYNLHRCDLRSVTKAGSTHLIKQMTKPWLAQMASGINYLHQIGIVHRDIKPENIFLDSQNNAMISNFEAAWTHPEAKPLDYYTNYCSIRSGTEGFMAPEVKAIGNIDLCHLESTDPWEEDPEHSRYGPACDWWSLGMTLFELATSQSQPDIDIPTMLAGYRAYLSAYGNWNAAGAVHYFSQVIEDEQLCGIVWQLLDYDPYSRIRYFDLYWHPYFAEDQDKSFFETLAADSTNHSCAQPGDEAQVSTTEVVDMSTPPTGSVAPRNGTVDMLNGISSIWIRQSSQVWDVTYGSSTLP
ncbi:kinase-like domain-containing protein [Coprinopsis sp. MPI-PUGE-AT-0042]|nr:kinase-like domain-containing protein [Coprinopsis sp. MPI-PUGE-AT-0042]